MSERKIFTPVRGTEEHIFSQNIGFNDGFVYFATDTNRIYLDYKDSEGVEHPRIPMGGAAGGSGNSGIFYANYQPTAEEKAYPEVEFLLDTIEGNVTPQIDDLIINIAEGCFYRVIQINVVASSVTGERLTVSGSGGGSASTLAEDIELTVEDLPTINLINGMSQELRYKVESAKNNKGNPVSTKATVTWTLAYTEDAGNNYTTYKTDKMSVDVGQYHTIDFGRYAKKSASSKITLRVSQPLQNGTTSEAIWEQEFSTSELSLKLPNSFSNMNFVACDDLKISCVVTGDMEKRVEYYFDDLDEPFHTIDLEANDGDPDPVIVSNYTPVTYGHHTVMVRLFQRIGNNKGIEVPSIKYEVAAYTSKDDLKAPIIWLGEYKKQYYPYETIQIPFRVYDPLNSGEVWVYFKKNGINLDNSPQLITTSKDWSYFEVSDVSLDTDLTYTISCGEDERETIRKVEIKVVEDINRKNFKVRTEDLVYSLNTIGSGRSNSESESHRKLLVNNGIAAEFNNFNWYNNGWVRDIDGKTCLRISNGASLHLPIGQMRFSNTNPPEGISPQKTLSHTIELMFKIRNVQDYSNLVHTITRYKNDDASPVETWDEESQSYKMVETNLFAEFFDEANQTYKTSYTNYDAFLAWYLKAHKVSGVDEKGNTIERMTYDDLIYDSIDKKVNLSNIVCGYYGGDSANPIGLCLGPQDAFFSNGTDKVDVSYVENKIITLSLVSQYDKDNASQNLISIYLNGVLTGIVKSTKTFTIESEGIDFNSKFCDIDLYKVRVYDAPLDVNNIIMNYAADLNNVDIYDQNRLAVMNDSINEYQFSYNEMIKYNNEHPDEPLMPYLIFDTSNSNNKDMLSYTKDINVNVAVEFVNTALEYAYTSGELEELAKKDGLWSDGDDPETKAAAVKKYYMHHCPSWKGENCNMAVQGTSSEFYPRRNYKIKTKTKYDADGEERVHIFLNRGPFAEDYQADLAGLAAKQYIKAATYDATKKYYSDEKGETEVTIDAQHPFRANTYYIKNDAYIKPGKEKTRQKYWYMDNYTAGTTKFTMKIDFMESSGSYNMGFANLVANAYSKHPLNDLNDNEVMCLEIPGEANEATTFEEGVVYSYLSHKGEWKTVAADSEMKPEFVTAETFAAGPFGVAAEHNITKVLGGAKSSRPDITDEAKIKENIAAGAEANLDLATYEKGFNKWFVLKEAQHPTFKVDDTSGYRTSVQGLRTLAFHKKSDGTYQFIGMYNMLLDKGSDEVYGFKPDKTTGKDPRQKFLNYKPISEIAECWEFENNNRTYCSFRDPANRKDLSFDWKVNDNRRLNSVGSAPVVVDSFEYRYHNSGDTLDYIYDPTKNADKKDAALKEYPATVCNIDDLDDRAKIVFDKYKNWEKACQWVWSTCTEVVESKGTYNEVKLYKQYWKKGTFYLYNAEAGKYEIDTGESYDASLIYFEQDPTDTSVYLNAAVCDPADTEAKLFIGNDKLNYYTKVKDTYVPCLVSDAFDNSKTYYELIESSEEVLDAKCDRLVVRCTADSVFDPDEVYYTYDGSKMNGQATTKVELTEEEFNANKTKYYVGTMISYGIKHDHKYDTKEYRADKFMHELKDHFDLEYMATYFVMTEVFECYDSRGKNCMMASWGPQEKDGEYIWYPIFYDIDTQLGVNNTGIPSFEYNVDATEDGNYSTSDSVLWNNFYTYFKDAEIISKYRHLKGITAGVKWRALTKPPLKDPNDIEKWYLTDPNVTGSIAMRGVRPLSAINLDEYYKYITITNKGLLSNGHYPYETGVCGHVSGDDKGLYTFDPNCAYFYMLQGDRSLSRLQFISNRLEYIDSWLNQGNYKRGGANRIRGRIAANNPTNTSDTWVETEDDTYYTDAEFGEEGNNKRHLFDAEYWLTLTPAHSSYVTLGDDAEAYPSRKYNGINPLKFNIDAIEKGIRQSPGYPEQLLYVYGMNQMQDLGDMSNLYWQEFEISGDASKLTSLKLGYDGVDAEGNHWRNNKMNFPSIPASKESEFGMPLLKEVNLCNLQINKGGDTLDFTSCEKLENFRATGSSFKEFYFADGAALSTLYLPKTLTGLELKQVKLLTDLITTYETPVRNDEGKLVAKPGLYLEDFFEKDTCLIDNLKIEGSGLGYNSYKLLKHYYDVRNKMNEGKTETLKSNITMTEVQWSPYVSVGKEDEYDAGARYYYDDGHYCLKPYTYTDTSWDVKKANGELYRLNGVIKDDVVYKSDGTTVYSEIDWITDIDMLNVFADTNIKEFRETEGRNVPKITGMIYINNPEDKKYKEFDIRNKLQVAFPSVKFFFANVDQAYTAKFLVMDDVTGEEGTYTVITQQSIESGWFAQPADLSSQVKKVKPNNDFSGWALRNDLDADIVLSADGTINQWAQLGVNGVESTPDVHDYYFYAICPATKRTVRFYSEGQLVCTMKVVHGDKITGPDLVPWKDDASQEFIDTYGLSKTWKIEGYSRSRTSTTLVDFSKLEIVEDMDFYTVWNDTPISVYENIHPEYFVEIGRRDWINDGEYTINGGITIGLRTVVKGKLTIPATLNGKPVVEIDGSFGISTNAETHEKILSSPISYEGYGYGDQVTHIFIEPNAATGMVNLRRVANGAFIDSYNLTYFEFAPGLRELGVAAFFFNRNVVSSFTANEIGGTIKRIENNCFNRTFNPSVESFSIGPSVEYIGTLGFGGAKTNNISSVTIGTSANKSNLYLGTDETPIINLDKHEVTILFYTNSYTANDVELLQQNFQPTTYVRVQIS